VKLFGVDIQAEMASAMPASDLTSMVLTKYTNGTPDPLHLTNGMAPTTTAYTCHGIPPMVKMKRLGDDKPNVHVGGGTLRIVGKSLADQGVAPEKGDLIQVDGAITYTIEAVEWDGYKAMFACRVRGA